MKGLESLRSRLPARSFKIKLSVRVSTLTRYWMRINKLVCRFRICENQRGRKISRPVLPECISVVPQLFQVLVEPSDNSIAEVVLVCIPPVQGRMAFSFVFCVFDVFA